MKSHSIDRMVRLFLVVWDDDQGIVMPMVWDSDCEGAICGGIGPKDRVALFTSRKSARTAIGISTRYALLCKAQGKPANDDFLGECRKNLRVVECQPNPRGELNESPPR
jgi:hypothetical protein